MITAKKLIGRSATAMFLILILLYIIPSAYALDVVPDKPLGNTLQEGQKVEFTLTVSDYPSGNYSIYLETDLEKDGGHPIYDFLTLNEKYIGVNRYQKTVQITPLPPNEMRIHVQGKTPSVRSEDFHEGLKIVKFNHGSFKYYEVKILDSDGQPLGAEKATKVFDVTITEQEEFQKKLERITIGGFTDLRSFADDRLYKKGLVDEANGLVDLLLKLPTQEPSKVNYLSYGVIFIVALIIGFLIGYRKGAQSENPVKSLYP